MCGRFTLRSPGNLMIEQFELDFPDDLAPRYNIAPTQQALVIRGADREPAKLRWGLIPFWSKDLSGGARMINARSETVATKPSFRNAFRKRRCLVPADGYIEWVKSGTKKQPYWIRMADERPFLMAGLWERWQDKSVADSDPVETFTILTTKSNTLTREIHDRMPVILGPNDYQKWLDTTVVEETELSYMFEPYDSNDMKLDPISDRVNSVRNDDEACLQIERTLF